MFRSQKIRRSEEISDSVSSRVSRTIRKAVHGKLAGFTLAELIVVITILAILATVGFLALSGYTQDAKDAVAKTNVRSVYTAITAASATSGNSPRYYVVHDSNYALSGSAIVAFDGYSSNLVAGDWNAPGTNYSAGNPDYVKLRLNKEKFRISSVDAALAPAFSLTSDALGLPDMFAATVTDPTYLLVGAADATVTSGSKTSVRSVAQVVALLNSGTPAVVGDYPVGLSGSVAGLVHDAANPSSSGALVDGAKTGSAPGCSAATMSGYSVPALSSGQSSAVSKAVSNGTVGSTASCAFGVLSLSSESASCNSGYVPSGLSCVADLCGSTVPANASSNASSQSAGGTWHYAASAGQCTFACVANYSWDGSSCRASCTVPVSDTWSGQTYAVTPNGALAHGASLSSSGTAAFGSSPANGSLGAAFSYSCSDGVLSRTATPGTGGCQANYTWNSNWSSPSCAANTQSAACGGSVAANATASTAATYAQTWNGSAWSPTTSWTNAGTTCGFACNSGYFWNGSSCAAVATWYPGCGTADVTLANGQIWATCNAGATTAFVGQTSYPGNAAPSAAQKAWMGAFYQWGRNDDVTTTGVTSTLASASATASTAGTTSFITGVAYAYDWISGGNNNLWGGSSTMTSGLYSWQSAGDKASMQGPCSTWYHVPTAAEWNMAVNSIVGGTDYTLNDSVKYNLVINTLKLPLPGERSAFGGSYDSAWVNGFYWTSSTTGTTYSFLMVVQPSNFSVMSNYTNRANGFSVRCIKN